MKKKRFRRLKWKVIDVSKLESVSELMEGIEERRERIEKIKARGWV